MPGTDQAYWPRPYLLCPSYALSGTDAGYAATRRLVPGVASASFRRRGVGAPPLSYAVPTRYGNAICYAMSGTDICICYAVSGTDVGICYAVSGTDIGAAYGRGRRAEWTVVSAYARAMRCPVLTYGKVLSGWTRALCEVRYPEIQCGVRGIAAFCVWSSGPVSYTHLTLPTICSV
eukprot:1357938-Rhodomonas_salina.4